MRTGRITFFRNTPVFLGVVWASSRWERRFGQIDADARSRPSPAIACENCVGPILCV